MKTNEYTNMCTNISIRGDIPLKIFTVCAVFLHITEIAISVIMELYCVKLTVRLQFLGLCLTMGSVHRLDPDRSSAPEPHQAVPQTLLIALTNISGSAY